MIFVSVAAFCDPFLEHTVRDAVVKAAEPESLVFGVVDQHPESRRAVLAALVGPASLRYVHIHPVETRGVCWARSVAFSLFRNEDFLLQVDSHMLFEQDWDRQLLEQHAALLVRSAKPMITVYPYGFEFEDGQAVVKIEIAGHTTMVMRPVPDAALTAESATLMFRTEHVFVREPLPGCHVAGGFLFASGALVEQVPYDPFLYFHGEEQSLAVRAWTRGWDIFHPPHIPLYHLYKMPNTEHRTHHWHPDWDRLRDFSHADLQAASRARLADLLYERRDLGAYGLGRERTLSEYARFAGIDYAGRRIVRDYQAVYEFV